MRKSMASWLTLGMWVGAFAIAPSALAVKVINVDSTADEFDDDVGDSICHTATGHCTLRAAVMQAVNNNPSVTDTIQINLPAGTYTFTIPLIDGGGELYLGAALNGDPRIEIDGAGAGVTIVDGNHLDRVFHVEQRRAILNGMTIRNGNDNHPEGGGGIYNNYFLALNSVVVTNNATTGSGGGISSNGDLAINGSSILSNNAAGFGGGIFQGVFGDGIDGGLNMYASTVAYNNAALSGGGILNEATLVIANSTIAANTATGYGGGIGNYSADPSLPANTYNTTIAFNDSDHARETGAGGGGVSVGGIYSDTFNIYNSVVAGNTTSNTPLADDCFGTVRTHARNRFGSTDGCSITQVSGSYMLLSPNVLGNLQDNGGPTLTIALPSGSNAINAGDPTFGCLDINGTTFTADQRGFPRNVGICDLGAYEFGTFDPKDRVFQSGFEIIPPI
jgi:hypothetical protein